MSRETDSSLIRTGSEKTFIIENPAKTDLPQVPLPSHPAVNSALIDHNATGYQSHKM